MRPPKAGRLIGGRTLPGVIAVRNRWMYTPAESKTNYPKGYHAFCRHSEITDSDWRSEYQSQQDLWSTIKLALSSFGDDVDLEIEVRVNPNSRYVDFGEEASDI